MVAGSNAAGLTCLVCGDRPAEFLARGFLDRTRANQHAWLTKFYPILRHHVFRPSIRKESGFDRADELFGAVLGLRPLKSAAAMAKLVDQLPVTIERLERALVLLAYFIELDGDVHLPMYEKFEAELAELKTKEAIKYRARKRLESYLNEGGGLKAIR